MMYRFLCVACLAAAGGLLAEEQAPVMNLLLNPTFEFHSFINHRLGRAVSYESHNVAFWNCAKWGDLTVMRESHAPVDVRPPFCARNLVRIKPGKKMWQFFTLPEAGLAHGERVSLHAFGFQKKPDALRARVLVMKLDSEDGTWRPADFGMRDKRTFPRHSRGELVVAKAYEAHTSRTGRIELRIDGAEIVGRVAAYYKNASSSKDINTIGLRVEFENASDDAAWVWSPSLTRSDKAIPRAAPAREMAPYYRYIPRTIQKLWKGETVHILLMGSSIDRGSANPPPYLYDEDPKSPTFKQPLAGGAFDAAKAGRPDLDGYIGWWRHYFSYAGRLRLELMRKFDLPVSKVCLNFMACDGSCVGEAHSGLAAYCSLSLPPDPGLNGHARGKSWRELYPGLFTRPEGPGPDLVIFGSGANEKTDTPDEAAVFEGMIRWIQRRYPGVEFLFCQFQNYGGYTPNPGDLMALSLRYQIPFLDYGLIGDEVVRWCNRYALVPRDGHPQAAAHYLWFKQLEKAFECWDPILPGQAQLHLPERMHPNSYGWEGDMVAYDASSPRIHGAMFIFEDTAINCWGQTDGRPVPYVDGVKLTCRRSMPRRDLRNSLFRYGRCRLGDRHVLEIAGKNAKLTYVDAKVCPNRRFFGVENPAWRLGGAKPVPFESQWGAPYGARQVLLAPGQAAEIDVIATDVSVAYVDAPRRGRLRVLVDGEEKLVQPTNQPFVDAEKRKHYMENRKGVLGLGYGWHTVRVEAADGPAALLGVFTYDSRSNRSNERRLVGRAAAGETVRFTPAFRARPVVLCRGGIEVKLKDLSPAQVTFSGEGEGWFEVVGE